VSDPSEFATLDSETARAPNITNTIPCVDCSKVYPWRGTPHQIAKMLNLHGGLCPHCVGYSGKAKRPGGKRIDAWREAS
jgi:hypothetical protein